jgi:hypothetical protein
MALPPRVRVVGLLGAGEEGAEPTGEVVIFFHVSEDSAADDDLAPCIAFAAFFLALDSRVLTAGAVPR